MLCDRYSVVPFRVLICGLVVFLDTTKAQSLTIGITIPFGIANNSITPTGELYAGAAYLAADAVNSDSKLLAGKTLRIILNTTDCTSEKTLEGFTYQWKTADVDGFIGTGCSCETSAKLAGVFNLPLISQVSDFKKFINIITRCNRCWMIK